MDRTLRCNSLKCRKDLNNQAAVTTCSHIFCLDCANYLQLINPPAGQQRLCPACETPLLNPDDAVIANLNPTEDYKTSVLSGLSPNIIMECAGRALSFWAYQNAQEIVYQEYQARTLTEKYSTLSAQMDKIVHDANTEISDIRGRLSNLHVDYDTLGRKNADLAHALREKTRKQMQTQELYDRLKRRALLGQVQEAASDAVDFHIQASASANRFDDRFAGTDQRQRSAPTFPDARSSSTHTSLDSAVGGEMARSGSNQIPSGIGVVAWNNLSGQEANQVDAAQTPSSHRRRLNPAGNNGLGLSMVLGSQGHGTQRNIGVEHSSLQNGPVVGTPMVPRRDPPRRSPLSSLNANAVTGNGFAGYGMSAGIKVSNLPVRTESANYPSRPTVRSRVANRPASTTFSGGQVNSFGAPLFNQFNNSNGFY